MDDNREKRVCDSRLDACKQEVHFASTDGRSSIYGAIWTPLLEDGRKPKGLVQLVHGMSEHSGRYQDFAAFLVDAGYAVCANDHIGHGGSVSGDGYGYLPPDRGVDIMLEDVDRMRRIAQDAAGLDVPYLIFGHSMGSLIVRAYIARHGEGIAGAVACGTADRPAVIPLFGRSLIRMAALFRGWHAKATVFNNLANRRYTRDFRNENSPLAWISRNVENVRAYIADEVTGFTISLGAMYTLMKLGSEAMSAKTAKKVPPDLPVLFIAGADDPVGGSGRDVEHAERRLHAAGVADVGLILYGGMRHEVLNEVDHALVYADVAAWFDQQVLKLGEGGSGGTDESGIDATGDGETGADESGDTCPR